LGLGLG
jgi:hypothetical protein